MSVFRTLLAPPGHFPIRFVVAIGLVLASACSSTTAGAPPSGPGSLPRPNATGELDAIRATPTPTPGASVDIGMRTVAVSPDGTLQLETVSTRAGYVTGGDVLITFSKIRETDASSKGELLLTLDGSRLDLGDNLDAGANGIWSMHITGVKDHSTLTATFAGTPESTATLALTNHPTTGPLFSGPKMSPFVCATERLGLGPSSDADCSVATRYSWSYVDANRQMQPLDDPANPPPGAATTTIDNVTVPFIVRHEQGVLGRNIYFISVLDPRPDLSWAGGPPVDTQMAPGVSHPAPAFDPQRWNRRLVYRYGGGCGTSYSNATLFANTRDVEMLGRGYALATGTLNTFQSLCNSVVSAEATLLVKERFIERYGLPDFTIGEGGSGGAIQQIQIAQNYPGLLDALAPSLPFPDSSSISPGISDCGLFDHYRNITLDPPTEAQWSAISGFESTNTCTFWIRAFLGGITPGDGCDASLADQVYDAATRPKGVRCTVPDSNVNIFGRDPTTGFARRALDNVGVQYGLGALSKGMITVSQFLDLNEKIGGYDIDGVITPRRTKADEASIKVAYTSGQITQSQGLRDVPIILVNPYTDPLGDIHDRFRVFSFRDRLRSTDGTDAPNLVIWTMSAPKDLVAAASGDAGKGSRPVFVLDEWLTMAKRAHNSGRSWERRLAANRPPDAVDLCYLAPVGRAQEIIRGAGVYDAGPCRDAYPVHGDPRTAAGAPRRNDILKCATRPVDDSAMAAYGVAFTAGQRQRLEAIFPDGVCDWTKPGVGQIPMTTTWPSFG